MALRRYVSQMLFWAAMFAATSSGARSGVCAGQEKTTSGAEQPSTADNYSQMLAQVQKGDLMVDFRAFRVAGLRHSGPHSSAAETGERAAFKNIAASGDWAGALDAAQRALARNYASPIAHFDAMLAYQQLGKTDEAAFHEKVLNALLDSIGQSGDGKSAKTAYFVVSVQEEYIFLNRVLHLHPSGQGTVREGKHMYDRLSIPDPNTGSASYVWFNADYDFPQ